MPIFNSLGSNYTFSWVLKSLFGPVGADAPQRLRAFLEKKYGGKAILFYKGREAIEMALKIAQISDADVAINGYTCFAVDHAVTNAHCQCEYIDIPADSLNFSVASLEEHVHQNPKIKAVIIQNTLGSPCEIEKIAQFCAVKQLILIEDLAHSVGSHYADGREAGTVGNFVALSFSQDKMIDGVSGGALIIRNSKYAVEKNLHSTVPPRQQRLDRFYPLLTFLIRSTYAIGVGKVLHALLKKGKLLAQPMGEENGAHFHHLLPWYCELIFSELNDVEKNLQHRQKIAKYYAGKLNPVLLIPQVMKNVQNSSNIRFPIRVKNRASLMTHLKTAGVFVSDIWYDAPIAPKKYLPKTAYEHQCPQAERLSDEMLNLPTHRNVSLEDAERISERINQWLELQ